jgi:lysyl-tRNA synthetase class 2
MNELQTMLEKRAAVTKAIRDFFWQTEFLEVETPQLVKLPSMEPYLEVFETELLDVNRTPYRAFLTSSPEFSMKKLLSQGVGKMFQICKSYRNAEGLSSRHNPEFTILEWYRPNEEYTQIMQDCEDMYRFVGQQLGMTHLKFRGKEFDLSQPWKRISVQQAFEQYAQVDEETLLDETKLLSRLVEKGYQVDASTTWEQAFNQIFLNEIEPFLGAEVPTILYEYPVEQAALSRRCAHDPRYAERFEFYIAGLEMGNAFGELTDWEEQLSRLQADRVEKERIGRTLYDIDMEFIEALKQGMPPTSGIAVGVDRVVMTFLNAEKIQDVLPFHAQNWWPEV